MCAYAIIIIAVFWMTEALPMAATALFPIMLMPFLGVAPSKIICRNYMKVSVCKLRHCQRRCHHCHVDRHKNG